MLCMAIEEEIREETTAKKKKSSLKYVLYILIVLIVTAISLTISLWGQFDKVVDAFAKADVGMIFIMVGLVIGSYLLDALVILVFCRLYTRTYKYHQGVAACLVGQFYCNVTPGASGGQIMEAYTMKSQGIQISNAASIMVMWFIIYQSALIGFDIFALIFEWNTVISITANIQFGDVNWVFPMWPLILIGFALNLFTILLMFAMSYSHKLHNFILHYVIGFFAKIRLIKNPDKTRENLRVQVENFKIELRRLQSNIPVLILQFVLLLSMIFVRCSIPYFAGLSLKAWGEGVGFDVGQMFHASFLSSFHQMVTGLMPLPGSAGVSELFYAYLFHDFYEFGRLPTAPDLGATIASTQILWRTVTFHLVLIVSGFVAALYRSRGQHAQVAPNRQTFVDLQLQTFDERRRSSETMYETAQLSRRELLAKLKGGKKNKPTPTEGEEIEGETPPKPKKPRAPRKRRQPDTQNVDQTVSGKPKKRRKKKNDDGWDNLEI